MKVATQGVRWKLACIAHTHAHKCAVREMSRGRKFKKQVVRDHTRAERYPLDLITVVIGDLGWCKLSEVMG